MKISLCSRRGVEPRTYRSVEEKVMNVDKFDLFSSMFCSFKVGFTESGKIVALNANVYANDGYYPDLAAMVSDLLVNSTVVEFVIRRGAF